MLNQADVGKASFQLSSRLYNGLEDALCKLLSHQDLVFRSVLASITTSTTSAARM